MVITLDSEQKIRLTTMLNIELRGLLTLKYATELNGIFKQLVGRDHESMIIRTDAERTKDT